MPNDITDANTDPASSTESDANQAAESSTAQADNTASTADTGAKTEAQVDAEILAKVEASQSQGSESPPDEAGKPAVKPGAKEEPPKPKSDEEKARDKAKQDEDDSKLPFNKHPRWQQMTTENKTLKTENETLKATAKTWEDNKAWMAERGIGEKEYPEILDMYATARQNQVSHQDFVETMKWRALVNTNPAEAIAYAEKWMNQLKEAVGQVLPADLQERVTRGEITEELAKRIAKAEAGFRGTETRLKQESELTAQSQVKLVEQATGHWLQSKCAGDPELQQSMTEQKGKFRALMREFTYEAQQQVVQKKRSLTPQEHVALLDECYTRINEERASLIPKPPARKLPLRGSSVPIKELPDQPTEAQIDANILEQVEARHGGNGF